MTSIDQLTNICTKAGVVLRHRKEIICYRLNTERIVVHKCQCLERSWLFKLTGKQQDPQSVRERTKFMFNNEHLSDVKFVVRGSDGGESETDRLITAHKFVLSIGSPVFEAMFYGELAETKDTIQLPDCDCESLLELFRYLYSDEVNLSGSNVLGVLYLAKKYMVPSLSLLISARIICKINWILRTCSPSYQLP